MNLDIIIPLTSASRLQSYLQHFCSRETFQLISFPLCGALPPTPLFHSLFLDSTIMKKGFLVKNVSPDFTNLWGLLFTPFSATRFAMHRIYANRINSRGMSRVFCDLRSQKTPRGILPVNSNPETFLIQLNNYFDIKNSLLHYFS